MLTGRFALALELLGPPGPPAHGPNDPSDDRLLRAAALVGLGRYGEVAALLGERPAEPAVQRCAPRWPSRWATVLAERLLQDPQPDLMDEAGRRRLLGELRIRRGRVSEGEELARQAMALYAGLDDCGTDVDEAYCSVLLGRAALRAARLDAALGRAGHGLRGLQRRPDNAPGLAEAHALVAEIRAGLGDAEGASEHLHRAREHALLAAPSPWTPRWRGPRAWWPCGSATPPRPGGGCVRRWSSTRRWARGRWLTRSGGPCRRREADPTCRQSWNARSSPARARRPPRATAPGRPPGRPRPERAALTLPLSRAPGRGPAGGPRRPRVRWRAAGCRPRASPRVPPGGG